ncbi:cellulose binding domain-containing protein [Streptomyces endophyticus]|uniref:Cellulose binding domain-containing protein n=1 Tax=Streptomyces endophyticus TaxID=714166 RepID=A0ABU6F853_9ACTN|nr:cellulose binding domain-containing protein [Streptomyces endophyticus]MEB8339031.1 cellulose binding domain-containing protein [Streptomyces endophyticus]
MAPPPRGPAGKRRKPRTSPAAWLSARASGGRERTRGALAGRRTGAFVAGGAVLVAATVGGVLLATGGDEPASLTARYQGTATSQSAFTGRYVIHNGSESASSDWKLSFTLPKNATLSSLSHAHYAVQGRHVTAEARRGDAPLAAGESVTLTLKARSTSGARPTDCSVDGAPCTIGAIPAPSPGKDTPPPKKHTPKPKPTHSTAPPRPVSFAPYVDTSLSPAFDLTRAAHRTGVKNYTLAFVKPKGDCTPQWGKSTLDSDPVAARIGALRSAGGDVRVSFGGQSGNELARTCTSASRLTSAYEQVIDRYKLTKVDFDIEGDALTDRASVDRRNRVVAALQRQHPGLDVSFTLPALPRGITADGLTLLRNAKKHGVDIGSVNAMAMNFGSSPAPHPRGRMGKYAIDTAESTHAQLKAIIGGSDSAVWNRVAVTPMIGVNDIDEEVFTLSDAAELGTFAKSKGMAWLSLWSATRDRACPDGPGGPAAATCSGVGQSADGFMKAFTAHTR